MKNLQSLLKYLIWPGFSLVTAGLVVGVLNGWTITAVALLVIGLMLIVSRLAAGDFNIFSTQFWQRRSTQAGTNATVSVLSMLVIVGLVNFVGARYDSRTDLTAGQLLTLSPASQEVVTSLEQPTSALIFTPIVNPIDQQLLENYRRFNSDFTYEYVDPLAQPQLAQELNVTGGEVFLQTQAPNISADSGANRRLLVQRINQEERLSERQLTNKLAQLSQEDIAVIYFLQGHGEYAIDGSRPGLLEAVTQLQDKNFTVAPLNLANTENNAVPDDADVVVIAGLHQALFESEVIALRDYLEQGGSLFVMVDPQIETGLEVLMSQWGVVPEKTIVIDTSPGGQAVGLGPAVPLVTDYGDHPITEAFNQGRSFYQVARPLQIREVPNIEVSPLLFTSQESYAETVEEGSELTVDPDRPPEGPFSLGVALSRPAVVDVEDILPEPEAPNTSAGEETDAETSEAESETAETTAPETANSPAAATGDAAETETNSTDEPPADNTPAEDTLTDDALSTDAPRDSRMVVIGNSTFATDGQFNRFLNGDVFLNSISWLSQIDNPTLSIQPKEATNRRFNMAVRQEILLTLLALVVFPLAGLIGAGTLWARRR